MPALGRRATGVVLPSGECLALVAEAATYSIPAFRIRLDKNSQSQYLTQDEVVPMGTRVAYTISDRFPVPTPVLYSGKNASQSYQPFSAYVLKDVVNPAIAYDPVQHVVHLLWWWNIWSAELPPLPPSPPPPSPPSPPGSPPPPSPPPPSPPPSGPPLPLQPPEDYYGSHSVPDLLTPAWLQSLVPKMAVPKCNPQRPFWVAPVPEGYRYDYWQGMTGGESKANGDVRVSRTPGAMLVQDMIDSGLIDYPGPDEANFGNPPSDERDNWERRGGIVSAGEHIRVASLRDNSPFVPVPTENPFTGEMEMEELPGTGDNLPGSTTWEDHLVIVNALKAHFDYANLGNATRVLMYARGSYLDGCLLGTVPKRLVIQADQINPNGFNGNPWPVKSEEVGTSVLLLGYPKLVAAYPCPTNYRTTINADRVWYPYLDYPDIGTNFVMDGFLCDCATSWVHQLSALDWVLSDPSEAAGQLFGAYIQHLDLRSF